MIEGGAFVRAAKPHEASGAACEDAALVGIDGGKAFAAVCDGCSSGLCDAGLTAKALARAALQAWRSGLRVSDELGARAWKKTQEALAGLGVSAEKSPSTLLAMELDTQEGVARFALWGDGALLRVDAVSGELKGVWIGSSAMNMPAYPAYAFDEDLWSEFASSGGRSTWAKQGAASFDLQATGRLWTGLARLEPGDCFMLSSDGVQAIERVEQSEVWSQLQAIKGPGNFIQRRCRKAIEDWTRSGSVLSDDFSVAALKWSPRSQDGDARGN